MGPAIGFVGTGNMGTAIIRGLAPLGFDLYGTDLDKARLEELRRDCGLTPLGSPAEVARHADYVLLAVKPQHARPVLKGLAPSLDSGKCLVSIAAGITMERLRKWSQARCPVVRVMPNTPALVGGGVSAICLEDEGLNGAQKEQLREIFAAVGSVHVLPESLFDAFTAVAGSGPAYVFYFMEALVEAGVSLGLSRQQATEMVQGLFSGSARLAAESGQHLSLLREMVTSPGGTTGRALAHLDRQAVRAAVMDAVAASYERSQELGK